MLLKLMFPTSTYAKTIIPRWMIAINGIQLKINRYKKIIDEKYVKINALTKDSKDILLFINITNGIVETKAKILINNEVIILLFNSKLFTYLATMHTMNDNKKL